MDEPSAVWRQYQVALPVRIAAATVAFGIVLGFGSGAGGQRVLILGAALLVAVSALFHPMALVVVLSTVLIVQEVLGGALSASGVVLSVGGFVLMQWRDARGLVRLWTIPILWVGLFLINPLLWAVLALVPLVLVAVRRRRVMQRQPSVIEVGTPPREWSPTIEAMRIAGFRYVGTIRFVYPDQEDGSAVVFRLGDARGWVVGADGWTVGHAFDGRHLFSTSKRWGLTLPHEFGQHVRSDDLYAVVLAHRRMIAHLASRAMRPSRPSDQEALSFLIQQWTLDADARSRAGWGLTLRTMVDEELDLRQRNAPRCLLDDSDGPERLARWIDR